MILVKMSNGAIRGYGTEDDQNYKRMKAWMKRLGAGEFFTLSYDFERNLAHHKKFMSLVSYVAQNSDVYNNKDKALLAIKIAAGHCDFVVNPITGELAAVPRSISFKKMKQGAFDEFYKNACQGVADHILPHLTKVQLQDALEKLAGYE